MKHSTFLPILEEGGNQEYDRNLVYQVSKKFRELNKVHYSNISEKVAQCKEELHQLQRYLSLNHTDEEARRKEKDISIKYVHLSMAEESFY